MENSNELNALKERVIKQLNDFYNSNSWVTDNLKKKYFLYQKMLPWKMRRAIPILLQRL